MQPIETIWVESENVSCDGGNGPLGHPLIYLTITNNGKIDCPYCGKHFIYKRSA